MTTTNILLPTGGLPVRESIHKKPKRKHKKKHRGQFLSENGITISRGVVPDDFLANVHVHDVTQHHDHEDDDKYHEDDDDDDDIVVSTYRLLMVGVMLLAIGTLGFYHIPGLLLSSKADDEDAGGGMNNRWIDAFYCTAITLTTVGFGDICPSGDDEKSPLLGRIFLIFFAFTGLGIFCGPVVTLASTWREHILPNGGSGSSYMALASVTLGVGVMIFTTLEELDQVDAVYASLITGTTIGFGDVTPKTNAGKIAVALYAIGSVQAVAILLEPARNFLEGLCRVRPRRRRQQQQQQNHKKVR